MVGNQGTLRSWGEKTKVMTKNSRKEPAIRKLPELREQGKTAGKLRFLYLFVKSSLIILFQAQCQTLRMH